MTNKNENVEDPRKKYIGQGLAAAASTNEAQAFRGSFGYFTRKTTWQALGAYTPGLTAQWLLGGTVVL